MLTDNEALLLAIRTEPFRDLPRLVYADFLDERDSPGDYDLAAFIRVQCEVAERETDGRAEAECGWGGSCECRACALRRHGACLLNVVTRDWELPSPDAFSWSRGFISEIRLPLSTFADGACEVCDGSGRLMIHHRTHGDCLPCDGTGLFPKLAKGLFSAHPITSVVLTDRPRR